MGASQINKPKLEQTTWTATVAEGLLEEANVCAWRPKKKLQAQKHAHFQRLKVLSSQVGVSQQVCNTLQLLCQ